MIATDLSQASPAVVSAPDEIRVSWVDGAAGEDLKPISVATVVKADKSGRLKIKIEAIRTLFRETSDETGGDTRAAKRAVDHLKKALPAITFSGTFSARGDVNLLRYSGLLCADLDDMSAEERQATLGRLRNDPHVLLAFLSPTGTGLKVVLRVGGDSAQHNGNFLAVKKHLAENYGLSVDETCKNLERLCFVSYDPDAYYNPTAVPLAPVHEPQKDRPIASSTVAIPGRQQIAEQLLGAINWTSVDLGFCRCPAQHLHTTGDGARDCEVHLDGAPTVFCLHSHCSGIVAGVNHELRSRVGRAETSQPGGNRNGLAAEYLGGDGEPEDEEPQVSAPSWPAPMDSAAFHGLAGDVVSTIDPHTEADPAAVLAMFLVAFGNLVGAGAHFKAEARRDFTRLFAAFVGETAKGRKGSAWANVGFLLELLDERWWKNCTASGLSSGEGLIHAVRDPIIRHFKNAEGQIVERVDDEGVSDKRLTVIEEEFGSVLKVAAREGNTVSDLLRRAWDTGDLRTMTRRTPATATGAHISVIGHITKADLSRLLAESDALNGFGNRFLWLAVKRSKLLPDGGSLPEQNLSALILSLRRALDFARLNKPIPRSSEARDLWHQVYPVLSGDRSGLFGAITNRAEAQVMRLALIYALLDNSSTIDVVHLQAALAVWDYCDRSARFIFGEALGDKLTDRILDELRCAGSRGLTRTELRDIFKRNLRSDKADAALATLARLNLAHSTREPRQGTGRPALVWRATRVTQKMLTQTISSDPPADREQTQPDETQSQVQTDAELV